MKNISHFTCLGTIFCIGLLYLLLPSVNHSGDTYEYALAIRDGADLFAPHHLLYNVFYFLLAQTFHITDTLRFICCMNALFAAGCLLFINALLSSVVENKTRMLVLISLGFCFGFMRYATTGETYILPLFFSLWASYLAFKRKNSCFTALIASLACLFHQIHFFWWLGLLFFVLMIHEGKRWKVFVWYGISSCIVPLAYLLVFYLTKNDSSSVFEFIVHDYVHNDDVEFALQTKALFLTPVSFVRTFYQVHGYILPLMRKYPVFIFFALLSGVCGIMGCRQLLRCRKTLNGNRFERRFAQAHLFIFVLQLLFAFISDGNAEFMVMLPFALVLFIFFRYRFQQLSLAALTISLFVWNLFLGMLPFHFFELTPAPAMVRYIENHPENVYYLKDRQTVATHLHYRMPDNKTQLYSIKHGNTKQLDLFLQQGYGVMSDVSTPTLMSRAALLPVNPEWLSGYNIQKQDSIPFDFGVLIVSRISSNSLSKNGSQGRELFPVIFAR